MDEKDAPHSIPDNVTFLHPAQGADAVLAAAKGEYDEVVIIGWKKDQTFEARGTLGFSMPRIAWTLQVFLVKMYRGDFGG